MDRSELGASRREFLGLMGAGAATLVGGFGVIPALESPARASGRGRAQTAVRRTPFTRAPRSLSEAVGGRVFTPGSAGYADMAAVYNARFAGIRPRAVARPADSAGVRDAIRYTTAHGIPVRARSGGHSYAGYSTLQDGVMIDLRDLDQITIDRRAGTATVGAGVQLIDLYTTLAAHGAMVPGGSCPSVGISGVTLGGGFGLAARACGLTADNLIGAQIVTADGALRAADRDLLWALRGGGGGNFGIVTEFTFGLHPLPPAATAFQIDWPWSSAAEAVDAWQRWAPAAPAEIGSTLHVVAGDPTSICVDGQFLGSSEALTAHLAPLLAVPGARLGWLQTMDYLSLQYRWAGCGELGRAACHTVGSASGGALPHTSFNAKSDYVRRPLDAQGITALLSAAESTVGTGALLCDAYGGAINRVAADATAFVHRDQSFLIQYYGDGASSAWIDQAWQKMRPHVSGAAYQNYMDPALGGWRRAYYGANATRLAAIRRQFDPDHYFNFPQAIA